LHIGHRESIDFDLFSHKSFKNIALQGQVQESEKNIHTHNTMK